MTSGYILLFLIWCSVLLDATKNVGAWKSHSHSPPFERSLETMLAFLYCFIQFFSCNQGSRREQEAALLLPYICSTLDMSLYFIVLDSNFFFSICPWEKTGSRILTIYVYPTLLGYDGEDTKMMGIWINLSVHRTLMILKITPTKRSKSDLI